LHWVRGQPCQFMVVDRSRGQSNNFWIYSYNASVVVGYSVFMYIHAGKKFWKCTLLLVAL
jgi:hypothetical protein